MFEGGNRSLTSCTVAAPVPGGAWKVSWLEAVMASPVAFTPPTRIRVEGSETKPVPVTSTTVPPASGALTGFRAVRTGAGL